MGAWVWNAPCGIGAQPDRPLLPSLRQKHEACLSAGASTGFIQRVEFAHLDLHSGSSEIEVSVGG